MSREWTGQWIWCADGRIAKTGEFSDVPVVPAAAHDRRVQFRRIFPLDLVPAAAPLRITADSRYTVWVNGHEAARGPGRGAAGRLLYDVVDVARWLVPGDNAICVLVRFYGEANAWWRPVTPTFSHGAGVLLAELELPSGVLGTDRSWRHQTSPAWTPQKPSGVGHAVPEVLDGALWDPAWLEPGFDDTGWVPARVLTTLHLGGTARSTPPADPYGPLLENPAPPGEPVERPVRWLRERRGPDPGGEHGPADLVAAVDAEAGPDSVPVELPFTTVLEPGVAVLLTAGWDQVVAGTLVFELDAPPGVLVDARPAEDLDERLRLRPFQHGYAARYRTRGKSDRFCSADPVGGRFALLVLRGEGEVTVRGLSVVERLRPRPPGPFFASDDPVLDAVYAAGLRTVDLTAQDAYIDCPTREQRAWTGDSVVHQSVDLLANPDWRLARWHPRLAASPRPDGMLPMAVAGDYEHRDGVYIPDWALHWVRSVHNLYRWTGDAGLVAELLPVAERVLRWFEPFSRGGLLTDVTGWVLLDWASVQGRGASSVLNGLWGRALLDFAEMAEWLGDAGRARWARGRHDELAAAFEQYWDEDRGGYRDWLTPAGVAPAMSEHATAAAAVGGLIPPSRRARALAFLLDRTALVRRAWSFGLMPLRAAMGPPAPDWDVEREVVAAQPFFRYVVHDAVALLGGADHIAALCRDWSELAGDGTWREVWSGGSYCHGWSSTPSRDLPLYVLGVSPAEPGFARARIAPRPGALARVAGAVPTPHGLVEVRLDRSELAVSSPVPFTVELDGWSRDCPAGRFSWSREQAS
ncbi:alpha-L-rhamnosidase-related protein [Amycolatopsis albidoflavus]|uniref:Alpha-L-rhamnosidase N-terminal domain-containing protein n=4 Tax=Amycolatopsis TaxID=1813 RepID=A0ABW5I4X5_9PSEU